MITHIQPDQYPELLAIQTESIRSLGATYSQEEIDMWTGYLDNVGPAHYSTFHNAGWQSEDSTMDGFVSWTHDQATNTAAIECLYVRDVKRGKGIGRLLLQYAELHIPVSTNIEVRSTLNARGFYEHNGYRFKQDSKSRANFAIATLHKFLGAN